MEKRKPQAKQTDSGGYEGLKLVFSRTEEDLGLVRELAECFLDEFRLQSEEIKRALEEEDYGRIKQRATELKSSGRLFVSPDLIDAAAALEQASEEKDLKSAFVAWQHLDLKAHFLIKKLGKFIRRQRHKR